MDNSNLFDQKIRDAVNKYEVPFDDSLWKNIEKEINVPAKATPTFNLKPWIIGASIAASIAIAYFAFKPTEEQVSPEIVKTEVKKETQVEDQNNVDSKENVAATTPINEGADENEALTDQLSETKKAKEENLTVVTDPEEDEVRLLVSVDEDEVIEEEKEKNVQPKDSDASPVEEHLIVDTRITKEVLCLNETVSVSISNSNLPIEAVWDFGDGYVAEGPSASHQYLEPGNYTIKLHAKSLLNDKLVEDENYNVLVNEVPAADFEIVKNENMYALPKVKYQVSGDEMVSFEWKFDDNTTSNEAIVEKLYKEKGNYSVGLVVENQYQCTDTLYKQVVIEDDFNLLAPNAFSPNGDGINDTFIPQALPYLNQGFTLQIFDPKTSQLVFETSNFEIPWNGMLMNNGSKMNEGAYAWSVKIEDGSIYKGTILITAK